MKHLLQNEFLLNKSICLLRNYHVYNQNVCFDTILCASLAVSDMQYLYHIMYSEILCIDFCYNCFLIWLTDYILDYMFDHDCEVSFDHADLEFQSSYSVYFLHHEIFCLSWVQYEHNIFAEKLSCCYHLFFIIVFNFSVHNLHNFC